jgi:cytochrome c-type biogenesis protein CcmH/NrfF
MNIPAGSTSWLKKIFRAPFISRALRNEWDGRTFLSRIKPSPFLIKSVQAVALAVAVCFSLGAGDSSARYHDINHRLMCTCGCAQLLGECNHVGCTASGGELAELRTDIANGMSDPQIFSQFTAKYGATVLAAPTTHGFDLVAWIAPFAVFGAALLGTILLIRRWSGISAAKAAAAGPEPAVLDPAEMERREKIRRETGVDGGY